MTTRYDVQARNAFAAGALPWTKWGSLQHSPRLAIIIWLWTCYTFAYSSNGPRITIYYSNSIVQVQTVLSRPSLFHQLERVLRKDVSNSGDECCCSGQVPE